MPKCVRARVPSLSKWQPRTDVQVRVSPPSVTLRIGPQSLTWPTKSQLSCLHLSSLTCGPSAPRRFLPASGSRILQLWNSLHVGCLCPPCQHPHCPVRASLPLKSHFPRHFLREAFVHAPESEKEPPGHAHIRVSVWLWMSRSSLWTGSTTREGTESSLHTTIYPTTVSGPRQVYKPDGYLLWNEFSLHRKDLEVGSGDMMLVFRADWAYKVSKCQQRS